MSGASRWPARIGAGIAILVVALIAASLWQSRPMHGDAYDAARDGTVTIAPVDQALTFARYRQEGAVRTLLVRSATAEAVTGVDLGQALGRGNADPAALFRELGFDGIGTAAASAPAVTIPLAELDVPFEGRLDNIGIDRPTLTP